MKHKLLIAVSSTMLMAMPVLASAQDDDGWYLRGNAGYGIHTDIDLEGGLDSSFHGNGLQSEGNVAGSLGVGYDFGNNWRVELDGDSLWTDFGSISQTPSTSAKLRTSSLMLNAIYDFDQFGSWEPYIGAGLGLVEAKADLVAHDFLNPTALVTNGVCVGPRSPGQGESCAVSDTDSSLGWQLLAGLGYAISDNLTWDTHYTYRDVSELDFEGVRTNGISGASNVFDTELSDAGSHSLLTGFRYKFGDRAPVAAPVRTQEITQYKCWDGAIVSDINGCKPQTVTQTVQQYRCWDGEVVTDIKGCKPQVVQEVISDRGNNVTSLCANPYRQEVIYYEFNKGQSAETRSTIGRILDIGEYCNVQNIRVVGHTDSSGNAGYNLALSERRAKDARDELVRQGIEGARITSEGKGETELAIATGDGVKEQLNRRTEVLISLGSVGVIN